MIRALIIAASVLGILTISGCGVFRGDRDVETEPASGSADGAGAITGKRGGIVIFQK